MREGIEIRSVQVPPELRADGDGLPKIGGYALILDSVEYVFGFSERFRPGAFDLATNRDVRALVEHDPTKLLGRTKNGTLALSIDERGLLSEITPPDTTLARDTVASIRRGDIDGQSIGFRVLADEWHLQDDEMFRDIIKAELFDVSVTANPVYTNTDVAVRSRDAFVKSLEDEGADLRAFRQRLIVLDLEIG